MKIFLMLLLLCPLLKVHPYTVDSLRLKNISDSLSTDTISTIKDALSDSVSVDTTGSTVDSIKLAKSQLVIPIYPEGFLNGKNEIQTISRNEIKYQTYNYTGDLLYTFPLAFQRYLGTMGQPHEVMIYGNGFSGISYMMDGLLLNNRFTNSLDLNYVQSESIDSIEIIPSPRGFLYGSTNNPVSVNFIPRENFTIDFRQGPYSRLRYYQASNEEAMIDAIYRTYLSRRLIGLFEMTNYTIGDRFPNTNHGSWKFKVDLNYLLSDIFNLKAAYHYNRTETRLFGGLDLDSLSRIKIVGINEPADETKPVNYPNRYQKYHQHQFSLMLRNKNFNALTGKINLYYINSLNEQRQNERAVTDSLPLSIIFRDNISHVYGAVIDQSLNNDFMSLQFVGNIERIEFENNDLKYPSGSYNLRKSISTAAASGKAEFNLINKKLLPSIFGKYLNYDLKSYYGIGADAKYNMSRIFSFYAGISSFTKPADYGSLNEQEVLSYEIGGGLSLNNINAHLKLFNQNFKDELLFFVDIIDGIGSFSELDKSTSGIGLDLNFNIWKINFETQTAYYQTKIAGKKYNILPEYTLTGKIYYKDTLFNENLFLKTGIATYYRGVQDYFTYNFFSQFPVYYSKPLNPDDTNLSPQPGLSSSFNMNFFLIGEIRKRAIIYFTFENLLGKDIYLVPEYQLPSRGIRLGVSWEFLN